MELDTSFISAASETDAPVQDGVTEQQVTEVPAAVEQEAAPAVELETPAGTPAAEEEVQRPVDGDDIPLSDEDIEKALADERTPKFYREQLKKFQQFSGKLKAERSELQTQIETLRSQYEGKEPLAPTDLERLRLAEERQYKLSSYTASADEVLSSLKEVINPNKFAEIKNHLAWEFLETPDGQPDLENLQVIIDRFAGYNGDGERVAAKDVLNAIQAIKRGTVKPEELHEFASDAEYEAFQRARSIEQEVEAQRQLARSNAEYQETQARMTVLGNVVGTIQGQFQPQVEAMLNKFQLTPVPNEPKVAAEFKQAIRERLAAEVANAQATNPSLVDVFKSLELLSKPTGQKADAIQAEINAYVNSFPYQTAVSRGLSELMQTVEKTVAQEAYRYKLMMMGYEQEVSKGQNAREVIGSPKQTEVLTEYTPEQLASMSARERRHAIFKNVSDQIREKTKTPRYGG